MASSSADPASQPLLHDIPPGSAPDASSYHTIPAHRDTEAAASANVKPLPIARLVAVNLILLELFGVILVQATNPFVLFSWHPIGIAVFVVGVTNGIVLQQNVPAKQKRTRTLVHLFVQLISLLSATAAVFAIYLNKERNNGPHFYSVHGKLAIFTLFSLWGVLIFGLIIRFLPGHFGLTVLKARKTLYPLHRIGGYFVYTLVIGTVAAAMVGTWATIKFSGWFRGGVAVGAGVVWVVVLVGLLPERKKVVSGRE
ncbi:hypothetical protein HDU97_010200 [Phlyctochytrium planicorne]|nr:hypothetical protein HDU97_010200 [Phlyctochytrium planicorne]